MKFHKRGFTSLLLFFGFLALIASGIALYGSPKGRVAHWTNWTICGLDKERWESIHVNLSILILIVSGFHLFFNWNRFWGYVKKKSVWAMNLKGELAASALLAMLLVLGAALMVPPFSSVMDLRSDIQTYWENNSPRAPAPHAEEFRLFRLAKIIGLPVEKVIAALREEGFEVEDGSATVRQVADQAGMAPSDVFAAITKHYKVLNRGGGGGGGRGECQRRRGARALPTPSERSAIADDPDATAQQPETQGKAPWIVLSEDLGAFQEPTEPWRIVGGAHLDAEDDQRLAAEPGDGALINSGLDDASPNLVTKQKWGDVEVALDFMIPRDSNSGVKLHGIYEIQIRDTYKLAKPSGNDCGGIYPKTDDKQGYSLIDAGVPPRVNAALAPGRWQTLYIVFRAPRFDAAGKKTANARFEKVTLNGRVIHENAETPHPTGWTWQDASLEHPTGPLLLQGDHGQVIFRNVRIRPLTKPDAGE